MGKMVFGVSFDQVSRQGWYLSKAVVHKVHRLRPLDEQLRPEVTVRDLAWVDWTDARKLLLDCLVRLVRRHHSSSVAGAPGRVARSGFRRLRPAQHRAQGRLAERVAQHPVGSEGVPDLGRAWLLPP
jgi:hypothetical protein